MEKWFDRLVKKYLVSLATEVDGHAQADAYILNVESGKKPRDEILKKIFVLMDYQVEYSEANAIYGTYVSHDVEYRFSLSYRQIDRHKLASQYVTGSSTDF